MQLTDEPEQRCYPLEGHLLCRSCHLHKLHTLGRTPSQMQVSSSNLCSRIVAILGLLYMTVQLESYIRYAQNSAKRRVVCCLAFFF